MSEKAVRPSSFVYGQSGDPSSAEAQGRADIAFSRYLIKDVDALTCKFQLKTSTGQPMTFNRGNPNTSYEAGRGRDYGQGEEIPSLYFRVNPSNISRPFKKIKNVEITMGGIAEFHGGDELDIISVKGVTGAMYVPEVGLVDLSLIKPNRKDSKAYIFLEMLIELFKSNANYYDIRGLIYDIGFIEFSYDTGIYKGIFETLSVSESANEPYSHSFDFSFIIEETIHKFPRRVSENHKGWSLNKSKAK